MTQTVTTIRDLAFPVSRVWHAISTGALISEWLMPNDFQPVIGHRFTLRADPMPQWSGVIEAEVLEVNPPHGLTYTWVSLGVVTEVTFKLEPIAQGTRLTVAQAGFRDDQPQNFNGARYGWRTFLARLDALLSKEP